MEDECPIPEAGEPLQKAQRTEEGASSSSTADPAGRASGGIKRAFEGDRDAPDKQEDAEDPMEPTDYDVGHVYMLGERRFRDKGQHPGKYEVVELFSPPRVTKAANESGLRGGWSLDIGYEDPTTGQRWDLSDPAAQEKVVKMIRRDKPLCVGMSPDCRLF